MRFCAGMGIVLIILAMVLTVSCAKKTVETESSAVSGQLSDDEAARLAAEQREAEARRLEEDRLRAEEEARMRKGAEGPESARSRFVNEDIYFDFDTATLSMDAMEVLREKAAFLRDNPEVTITIEGHCDERGTNEYNLSLGDRRSNSAKAYLMDLGIDGSRMTTVSYGEEQPVDPGHNEEAWAKNRRGHFVILE